MTCAQITEETRTLRIARAGHCPTLLIREGQGFYSRPNGLGLAIAGPGLFDRNLCIEEVSFQPGDYAVFFSDGLPEAHSIDGREFGYEELMNVAVRAAAEDAPPLRMRDAIFEAIEEFEQGEPTADDSTLIVLRWR
jgi:serine phosphatase RsbU (regulator of sigma subunit)